MGLLMPPLWKLSLNVLLSFIIILITIISLLKAYYEPRYTISVKAYIFEQSKDKKYLKKYVSLTC